MGQPTRHAVVYWLDLFSFGMYMVGLVDVYLIIANIEYFGDSPQEQNLENLR